MTNTAKLASIAAGLAVVVGVIAYLQGFNAEEVACPDIAQARAELQAAYDRGVNASVEVYADERSNAEEVLSQCLSAKPKDPCEDAQKARDEAVAEYNSIQESSFGSFNEYFAARETAYQDYKAKRDVLAQCREQNPPPTEVPYEKSDTKKCFDEYDAAIQASGDTFNANTQAMRAALRNALADLDAREKACNPPTGSQSFTNPPGGDESGESQTDGEVGTPPIEIANCQPLPEPDAELSSLRARAAEIQTEISEIQTSIDNANRRIRQLEVERSSVPTSTPLDENGNVITNLALANAKRGQRIENIDSQIEYYNNYIERRNVAKTRLEAELSDVKAQIAAREEYIRKENQARQRAYPTNIHIAKPEKGGCDYFHCHGTLCGKPDPAPGACGHGSTTEGDVGCKEFFRSYLKAAGA